MGGGVNDTMGFELPELCQQVNGRRSRHARHYMWMIRPYNQIVLMGAGIDDSSELPCYHI